MLHFDAIVRPVFDGDDNPEEKLRRMAYLHALAVMRNFPGAKVSLQGLERSLMKAAGIQARRDLRRSIRMRDDYEDMFRSAIAAGIAAGAFRDESVGLMTKSVLGELQKRLATGPLRHDAQVPFFHFYGGRMHRDVLGVNA